MIQTWTNLYSSKSPWRWRAQISQQLSNKIINCLWLIVHGKRSGVVDKTTVGSNRSPGKLNVKFGPLRSLYFGINMFLCVFRSVFRWLRVLVWHPHPDPLSFLIYFSECWPLASYQLSFPSLAHASSYATAFYVRFVVSPTYGEFAPSPGYCLPYSRVGETDEFMIIF